MMVPGSGPTTSSLRAMFIPSNNVLCFLSSNIALGVPLFSRDISSIYSVIIFSA
jgi:hypothetical protein